jgi:hypothetical protein
MPLFDPTGVYRTKDIEGPNRLCPNHKTRKNWEKDYGFPPGRLTGRLRTFFGWELNEWVDSRPTESLVLPEGVGGAQPGAGRPRKQSSTAIEHA